MTPQELHVQPKRALEQKQEETVPGRAFIAMADIYETDEALTVVLEMPGVDKSNVEIGIEDDVLSVEGKIDFAKYHGLTPIYTEYPVGHYRRGFSLSNRIDQSKISADMSDGVLTITLPKVEEVKPRRINVGHT
jgi:HSP20 family molecular chaperone IbpA